MGGFDNYWSISPVDNFSRTNRDKYKQVQMKRDDLESRMSGTLAKDSKGGQKSKILNAGGVLNSKSDGVLIPFGAVLAP